MNEKQEILDLLNTLIVILDQHGLQPDDACEAYLRALKVRDLIKEMYDAQRELRD